MTRLFLTLLICLCVNIAQAENENNNQCDTLVAVASLPPSLECPAGGILVTACVSTKGGPVYTDYSVCNGIDGVDGLVGPVGPQGIQGLAGINAPYFEMIPLPPGHPVCSTGGTEFILGEEVSYACNGLNGMDGANGFDGAIGPQGPAGIDGSAGKLWTWVDAVGQEVGLVGLYSVPLYGPNTVEGLSILDDQGYSWLFSAPTGTISWIEQATIYYTNQDCTGDAYAYEPSLGAAIYSRGRYYGSSFTDPRGTASTRSQMQPTNAYCVVTNSTSNFTPLVELQKPSNLTATVPYHAELR